ncbi:MAG: hypothetical protein ACR2OM_02095 [Aestuariivirgaceae bacterium]
MQDQTSIATDMLAVVLMMLGQQPLDAPRTVSIEPQVLQERVCGRKCRVFAWYAPEGTIYLDNRLDLKRNVLARGVLVHELVHHIQRMRTGRVAKDCKEWRARERAAYAVQSHWLRQQGVVSPDLMLQSRLVRC